MVLFAPGYESQSGGHFEVDGAPEDEQSSSELETEDRVEEMEAVDEDAEMKEKEGKGGLNVAISGKKGLSAPPESRTSAHLGLHPAEKCDGCATLFKTFCNDRVLCKEKD
ncbi:unnamed protein product [Gadus morhua 'NCC']